MGRKKAPLREDHYFIDANGNKCAYNLERLSFQNSRRMRRINLIGSVKNNDGSYDELEELFELYKSSYKDWKESDQKSHTKSIRVRRILSLIRKVAKRRRFEIQEHRYKKKLTNAGLK